MCPKSLKYNEKPPENQVKFHINFDTCSPIFYIGAMPDIRPIHAAQLKRLQKLNQKKFRQEEGIFLAEGLRLVEDALASGWEIESLLLRNDTGGRKEPTAILEQAHRRGIQVFEIAPGGFAKIADTVTSQGIACVVGRKSLDPASALQTLAADSVIVALEEISDPGNLGTILRTCDWFGVGLVVMSRGCVELYNPKVVRSTMGAIFHVPVCVDVDLLAFLEEGIRHDHPVIATALEGGQSLSPSSGNRGPIVVFGNEARGVSDAVRQLAATIVTIPRHGKAESLNVAVACGVILNELARK